MASDAEEEAQRIMQAVRFKWAEPISAEDAADHILDLADRIRAERKAAARKRPRRKVEPSAELCRALDTLMKQGGEP